MATADTSPVTIAQRQGWFADFDPSCRPLWVAADAASDAPLAWLSLRSFYGRPAYHATVEIALYTDPAAQRKGLGRSLLRHALDEAPKLAIRTMLAFVFGHNRPSLALFESEAFAPWGRLPEVAEIDGLWRDLVILGRVCPRVPA